MDTYYIGIYNISQTSTSYSQEVKCNFSCPPILQKKCIAFKITTPLFLLYLSTICYKSNIMCIANIPESFTATFSKS